MKKLTKGMIKACKSFASYKLSNEKASEVYKGCTHYDATNDIFYVCGRFGAVRYVGLDADSRKAVTELIGCERDDIKLENMFRAAFSNELYPDSYFEVINFSKLRAEIYEKKKSDKYKKAGFKRVTNKTFNSLYDMELYARGARCVGEKEVIAHYPFKGSGAIFLVGDTVQYDGYGLADLAIAVKCH